MSERIDEACPRTSDYNLDAAFDALAQEARRIEEGQDRDAARALDSRLGNIRARLARKFSFGQKRKKQ